MDEINQFVPGLGSHIIFLRLRLLIFFQAAPGIFYKETLAPAQMGQKHAAPSRRTRSDPLQKSHIFGGSGSRFLFGAAPAPGFFFFKRLVKNINVTRLLSILVIYLSFIHS